ncbi:MAG: dihydroneopterin aldolase [Prevotellaceae bacterium]|jgi:dihydroneopterin aldolase|nr:dihydroneopterin aldolase [Prevotellaceae bacterium]
MALIEIENMEFFARHGCFPEERIIGNRFIVSLAMEVNADRACESDEIADAVNYQNSYEIVKAEMQQPSHLLEHVAKRILDALFKNQKGISKATVKVSKINPPMGGQIEKVSLSLSRESKTKD